MVLTLRSRTVTYLTFMADGLTDFLDSRRKICAYLRESELDYECLHLTDSHLPGRLILHPTGGYSRPPYACHAVCSGAGLHRTCSLTLPNLRSRCWNASIAS